MLNSRGEAEVSQKGTKTQRTRLPANHVHLTDATLFFEKSGDEQNRHEADESLDSQRD